MTAHSLPLAVTLAGDVRWPWLSRAVSMAAAATAAQPPGAGQAQQGWTCWARVATRRPAPDTRSVAAARDFSLATVRRWGITERADDITIVVSELLTNALRHGLPSVRGPRPDWPVHLGLVWPGRFVLCAVADPGAAAPRPKEPDYFAESGRGLHVISALSDAWGVTPPTGSGKTVWAVFAVGSAPLPPAAGRPPAAQRLATVGGPAGPRCM